MASSDDLYSTLRDSTLPTDPPSDAPETEASVDGEPSSLSFDAEQLDKQLRNASEDELHSAPFGLIKLDDEGIIEFYNHYESELSGIDSSEAIGKEFFTQVAPCTNNNLFLGRFEEGVRADDLDEHFTYTFTYKVRPTLVDVRLFRDESGSNWILTRRR